MTSSQIKNARRWAPGGPSGWFWAAVALIVATVARLALQPYLGPERPDFAFYIAAAIIAFNFGLWPAITVMTIGFFITDYMFIPPYREIMPLDHNDVILALSYPTLTSLIIGLIEWLRRGQYHAEMVAAVARCRYEMLLRADNERLLARRDAGETQRLLRALTEHHDRLVFIRVLVPQDHPVTAPGSDTVDTGSTGTGTDSTTGTTVTDSTTGTTDTNGIAANAGGTHDAARSGTAPSGIDNVNADAGDVARESALQLVRESGLQPGARYDDIHPDDVARLSLVPTLGAHKVRLRETTLENLPNDHSAAAAGDIVEQFVDAVCERFTTPSGQFLILRLESSR